MPGIKWTDEQIQVLTEKYGKVPMDEIVKLTGRTIDSVWTKAVRLGLSDSRFYSDGIHCLKCGDVLTDSNWHTSRRNKHYHICNQCFNRVMTKNNQRFRENHPEYYKENWEKYRFKQLNKRLKRVYGITYEEALDIEKSQDYKCAICKKPFDQSLWHNGMTLTYKFVIDHDHQTNNVRGLLCQNCNTLIGHAHDNIEILNNAVEYLQKSF